jgi:flagellar biosynthesis protein FlhA
MDGASKFVRGDAVAGILIMIINVVAGFGVGMLQHDLTFDVALKNYTLLAIGDGLVAQIPSLLLSVAAAIMVTRVSGSKTLGDQVRDEMFTEPRALAVSGGLMATLGLIPGMPHVAFLSLAALCGAGAWLMARRQRAAASPEAVAAAASGADMPADAAKADGTTPGVDLTWDDVQPVDMLGLEVGYRLIALVDKSQGGDLLSRIKGVRKKLSTDLGFLVPTVHIRDNLELLPNAYRITLMGVSVGESEVQTERMLAINPGDVFGRIDGMETRDPAFGLPAVWIAASDRERAVSLGYTVVDASTVVATHLNHIMQRHADELLGHDEAQQLLERLRAVAPKLAEALVPGTLTLGVWLRVLQNLLREQVPIRDLRTIAESVIDASAFHKDPEKLTAAARVSLGRMIVQSIYGPADELAVLTLDPELEQLLSRSANQGPNGSGVEPGLLDRLQRSLMEAAEQQEAAGRPAVLVVNDNLRTLLARFVRFGKKTLHVLSFAELPDNKQISVVANIGTGAR